jgi:hypothetical protein
VKRVKSGPTSHWMSKVRPDLQWEFFLPNFAALQILIPLLGIEIWRQCIVCN